MRRRMPTVGALMIDEQAEQATPAAFKVHGNKVKVCRTSRTHASRCSRLDTITHLVHAHGRPMALTTGVPTAALSCVPAQLLVHTWSSTATICHNLRHTLA